MLVTDIWIYEVKGEAESLNGSFSMMPLSWTNANELKIIFLWSNFGWNAQRNGNRTKGLPKMPTPVYVVFLTLRHSKMYISQIAADRNIDTDYSFTT